jgi:hypothetical protein
VWPPSEVGATAQSEGTFLPLVSHARATQEGLFGFKPFPELWVGRMASACPGRAAVFGGAVVGAAVREPPKSVAGPKWAENLPPCAHAHLTQPTRALMKE